jgi:lipopolysaccharide/colanic/teichoic acid biosynthesis glycosyltransferase
MSFVGPRPCLPNQTELIAERAARGVFDVRPGITGPAQLAGIDMSTPRKLAEADAAYIASRSMAGDLRLILQTASGGGRGDAVKPS